MASFIRLSVVPCARPRIRTDCQSISWGWLCSSLSTWSATADFVHCASRITSLKKIALHQNNPGPNLFHLWMCELGKSLINFHPKNTVSAFQFWMVHNLIRPRTGEQSTTQWPRKAFLAEVKSKNQNGVGGGGLWFWSSQFVDANWRVSSPKTL